MIKKALKKAEFRARKPQSLRRIFELFAGAFGSLEKVKFESVLAAVMGSRERMLEEVYDSSMGGQWPAEVELGNQYVTLYSYGQRRSVQIARSPSDWGDWRLVIESPKPSVRALSGLLELLEEEPLPPGVTYIEAEYAPLF